MKGRYEERDMMKIKLPAGKTGLCFFLMPLCLFLCWLGVAQAGNVAQVPLFVTQSAVPQVMLTMSNDHQLYFEAYPDYADLTGDGKAERTYNHEVDYYGYFDPYKCYIYSGSQFEPVSTTHDKYCNQGSSGEWSGNFLNYVSMARIDVIRKILYGGLRSTDTSTETVLERTYLPNDAHSWVRYYDGEDLPELSPFSLPPATTTTSQSAITVPGGSRNGAADRRNFITGWTSAEVQVGDQLYIESQQDPQEENVFDFWIKGVVRGFSGGNVEVQVTSSSGESEITFDNWLITNNSRLGVSFCNTTVSNTQWSHNVSDPPFIRVAAGNYSLWNANERWQCRWREEKSFTGHDDMMVGGLKFSNGNDMSVTGLSANSENPLRDQVGLGERDYIARVQACVSSLPVGGERCKSYPDGNLKPIGLLQQYGDDGRLHFGLLSGSYARNKSGGVLRKNISSLEDEVNVATDGTFTVPSGGSIIESLNLMRIYGYSHHDGTYGGSAGDNCPFGLSSFADGRCTNWGNPQSEMFLESLRYFAGKTPYTGFVFSGDDKIPGLGTASWVDPLCNENWCADLNIIAINSSISSYDDDQYGGLTDLGVSSGIASLTNIVGAGEGLHNEYWFIGESGNVNDRLCGAKEIDFLGNAKGLCPEAPSQAGTFHIAGLAHYAYTESIRDDLTDSSNNTVDIQVKTHGVELAPAVPSIHVPLPGETETAVRILPACVNTQENGRCGLVDFKIVQRDIESGTGKFLINWEAAEWGGDYDMDMNGILSYQITESNITITTEVFAQSSSRPMAFGYIISGTTQDGFHAHSGINSYSFSDPTGISGCSSCTMHDAPTAATYTLGSSTAGLFNSPLYYAAKWGGFNKKLQNDFPQETKSWDSTGDGVPDNYYLAIDPAKLAEDLEAVFVDVVETTSSAASVVANSVRLDTGTYIYQARFRTTDWSGELIAYPVLQDGSIGEMEWEAGSAIPLPQDRSIFTYNPLNTPQGVSFEWSNLNETQKNHLKGTGDDSMGQARLNYIRGVRSGELQHGGTFRDRARLLGDIINSDPVYVGAANFGYNVPSIPEGFTDNAYNTFRDGNINRTQMIYLGANDGMLHGFRADDGEELFAFIPNEVIKNLADLTDPAYEHQYYVDGPARMGDAFINGEWRTVLLGSTGAGGRSVFALDVTDPDTFSAADVLWEFTHDDLGYTIGQPTIARLANGQWVAIFGNGYGSSTHKAKLFVVNLATGALIKAIDTGAGNEANPNGLSTPIPVDTSHDRITEFVYAGDLHGNLWKFDLAHSNSNQWGVAHRTQQGNNPAPLFSARDSDDRVQPITARPAVGSHPKGGVMVYFGTGKFFEVGDNIVDHSNDARHTFYGIHDKNSGNNSDRITTTDRSELKNQEITHELQEFGRHLRVTTKNSVNYDDTSDPLNNPLKRGWYMDLISPQEGYQGERVVSYALLRHQRIIFNTLIPSDKPCDHGGTSWLMELDALTGGRLEYSVFDLNNDGLFNDEDYVIVEVMEDGVLKEIKVPVSGIKSEVGIIKTPAVISAGEVEYKFFSGSSGALETIKEKSGSGESVGRQSWRQLQ